MSIFIYFILLCFACEGTNRILARKGYCERSLKREFILITGVALVLIMGLRHSSVGPDTDSYVSTFYHFRTQWEIVGNVMSQFDPSEYQEPLFYFLTRWVASWTDNYTIYLMIPALVCGIACMMLFYRYSKWPLVSMIAVVSLSFIGFFMTGTRQALAIGILIFAYKYVRERKLIPFLLTVGLAYCFHNSAIVFLIAYPIAYLKVNWKQFAMVLAAYLISIFSADTVEWFLFDFLQWERLENYQMYQSYNNLSGFVIQFCIMLFCMYYYRRVTKETPQDITLYNIMFVGLAFQVFTPLIAEFFRISMYFSIFNTVLIANAIRAEKNPKNRAMVSLAVLGALLIYFIYFNGAGGYYRFADFLS